ncbi:hypothetical protein ElyMa_004408100 [Elysia marginata]|uniref:Uncharacterized protein n=1 Tax=Elysia marginata TaxID=1093978 RepID=A0AAV4HC64_9GAST|nr:hypothetical protein ElyMa_004408100 [Elysia marginata]
MLHRCKQEGDETVDVGPGGDHHATSKLLEHLITGDKLQLHLSTPETKCDMEARESEKADRYCETFGRLRHAVPRKIPGLLRTGVVLQHDTAPPPHGVVLQHDTAPPPHGVVLNTTLHPTHGKTHKGIA